MNYLTRAKRAVYEAIYHKGPAIVTVPEFNGNTSINVLVNVDIKEEIVKSFTITSDKPIITSIKLTLTAEIEDRLETPHKITRMSLSSSVDPEIVLDENGDIDQHRMGCFKETLVIRISGDIAQRFKHEQLYEPMPFSFE